MYKINKFVKQRIIELKTKTCLISNGRNRMLLTLVSPVCFLMPIKKVIHSSKLKTDWLGEAEFNDQ